MQACKHHSLVQNITSDKAEVLQDHVVVLIVFKRRNELMVAY